MDGFLIIDKPSGISSHDVVAAVRRALRLKKVGHTGTLDPFATGVLPVAVGEATKAIPFLDEQVKEYQATMVLGITTDSQDCTGEVVLESEWQAITTDDVRNVLPYFTGHLNQTPPMYSAIKKNGIPLYRLARKGVDVERAPRPIDIFSLQIDDIALPEVTLTVVCSRGTYVRTLAHDMGTRLGCGAHLTKLRRIRSGMFGLENAITLAELVDRASVGTIGKVLVPVRSALDHLPSLTLSEQSAHQVRCGKIPGLAEIDTNDRGGFSPGERIKLVQGDQLIAVAESIAFPWQEHGENLKLLRVFN